MTPQEEGRLFEQEIAQEFGLRNSFASGSFWFDPLDINGRGTRWSAKYTRNKSFPLSQALVDEAVEDTSGPGADGSIPIWVVRLQSPQYDLIVLQKEDFKLLLEQDFSLTIEPRKSEIKRQKLNLPILMREEDESVR